MGDGSAELVTDLPPGAFAFVLRAPNVREHVLLFCLLGLVLAATIILVIAPGAECSIGDTRFRVYRAVYWICAFQ